MATTKVTTEELDRRVDSRLRLRGLRLYRATGGDRHIVDRFSRQFVQRDINYVALVRELGALRPDEEFVS
jgi:hypothetical protein